MTEWGSTFKFYTSRQPRARTPVPIDEDPLRQELTNSLSSVFRVEHAHRPSVTNGA